MRRIGKQRGIRSKERAIHCCLHGTVILIVGMSFLTRCALCRFADEKLYFGPRKLCFGWPFVFASRDTSYYVERTLWMHRAWQALSEHGYSDPSVLSEQERKGILEAEDLPLPPRKPSRWVFAGTTLRDIHWGVVLMDVVVAALLVWSSSVAFRRIQNKWFQYCQFTLRTALLGVAGVAIILSLWVTLILDWEHLLYLPLLLALGCVGVNLACGAWHLLKKLGRAA